MKQAGTIVVYMLIGLVLGTVFSLLLIWPFTPHMQYLKSEYAYRFSFIGMICGSTSGLFISLLSPRHDQGILPTTILGAICGVFTMRLETPFDLLKTNWVYILLPIGLLAGSILGLFIYKLALPHKLDVAIQKKLSKENDIEANKSSFILFSGAILGGTAGAILTVVAVIFYLISTADSDPFTHTFGRIQHYYFFIPIGSLLVIGYLFAKRPAGKIVHSMEISFSEGVVFGVMTGLMIEVLLLIFLLSAWVNSGPDNSLASGFMIATFFSTLIAFSSAMFGMSVSLTSNALIDIFSK